MSPGIGFGPLGEGYARFALVKNEQRVKAAAPTATPARHTNRRPVLCDVGCCMIRLLRWCLLTLILACLTEGTALAQATGRLSGIVKDRQGSPVAGARVKLVADEMPAANLTAVTSRDGTFVFPALRPATYTVVVNASGFLPEQVEGIRIAPAVEISLAPVYLFLPTVDRVPLGERAPSLQPAATDIASTATSDQAGGLPLPRRDPFYLVQTLAGVQNNGRAPLAIYGESAALANIVYDGVPVNRATFAPRTDQVGEATVVTGAIDGCGCSQVSFSTPGGGRTLHGAAYWLGIPGTAAQDWADNSHNTPASTSLNQLGARLGGPLKTNRLFFFVNYEADLDRSTVTRTGQVPTSPSASADPLVVRVLALVPSDPSGQYRGVQNNGGTTSLGLARLDYLASDRHTFGLTFADRNATTDDPSDSSVFGRKPTTTIGVSAPFLAASWRWSVKDRLTNEVRAGANRAAIEYRNSLRSQFGFVAILDDPKVPVSQPMLGIDPEKREDAPRNLQDNLTWVHGRHILRAGVWFEQYRLDSDGFNDGPLDSLTVPRYTVGNLAVGTVTQVDQRFNIASPTSGYASGTTARSRLSASMISGFVHDDWRLLRSLTISFGLRYDYLSRANERTGSAIIPVFSGQVSDAVYDQNLTFAFASSGQPFYRRDFDNYDPYVGLAWKPFQRLPLAVRGGFNIAYLNDDLLPNMSVYALQNPFQSFNVPTDPIAAPVRLSQVPATPVPTLPSSLTLASLLSFANGYHQQPGTVYAIDWNIRTPNLKYWNVGVEGEVRGVHLDVRYVGNRLEEAPRSVNRNQVMLSPDFLAAFGQVQAALKSGALTSGFPGLLGGGLCANFSLQNCQPDLYARSLILSGQAGELGRWYQGQGYNPNGAYNFLGNPLAPQGIDLLSQLGTSRYDALQATAARRVAAGLNLTASYVFSKALSSLDDPLPGAVDPYLNLHNPALEWAPSPFNLKHAFKATAIWDVPRTGKLLGGWSVSGIVIAQSGAPFSLLSGGSVVTPDGGAAGVSGLGTSVAISDSGQNTVQTSLTAGQIAGYLGIRKSPAGTVSYVNAPAGAFQEPAAGTAGNLQRRMFSGPGVFNLNLGLRKSVPIAESARAEFRAESINLLNNVNWLVGDQTYLGNGQFGNNITQWNAPRTFQFSLRLLF